MTDWLDLLEDAKNSGVGFDPLPAGPYDVKIVKSAHKISQTGKSMFEVEMQIISGPHANRRCWDRYVVTPDNPKALAFFFSKMKTLGLTTEFFAARPTDEQVANTLLDRMVTVELGQVDYQGTIRNEVKKLRPLAGSVATTPVTPTSPMSSLPPVPPAVTAPPTVASVASVASVPPVASVPVVGQQVPVVPVVPAPVVDVPPEALADVALGDIPQVPPAPTVTEVVQPETPPAATPPAAPAPPTPPF